MTDPVSYGFQRTPFGTPQQRRDPSRQLEKSRRGRSSQPGAGGITEVRCDHQYASIVDLNVNVDLAAVRILDSPAGLRNLLAFRNNSAGAQTIFLGFGREATLNSTFALQPGQLFLFDSVVPQEDIWAIANAAGGALSFAYSIIPEI